MFQHPLGFSTLPAEFEQAEARRDLFQGTHIDNSHLDIDLCNTPSDMFFDSFVGHDDGNTVIFRVVRKFTSRNPA